jgi:hypothetical protein
MFATIEAMTINSGREDHSIILKNALRVQYFTV